MLKQLKYRTLTPLIIRWGRKKISRCFTAPPVIIGGCGRSGTTLLLSILDAHPHIYSIPVQTYAFMGWRRGPDGAAEPKRPDRLFRQFLFRRLPASCTRWCEKTPMHVRYFNEILGHFGDAVRLIHIIRDGRDVVTSSHPSRPGEYWVPVERWVNDVSAGLRFREDFRVLTIKYEDLVTGFVPAMETVFAFLDENVPAGMEQWSDRTRVRKSRHWHRPVRPLDTSAIGRWRQERHRERVREFMDDPQAAALLKKLEYTA